MKRLFVKGLGVIFRWVKTSPRLSNLYYQVANLSQFGDLAAQEAMLADTARVDTYYRAIQKYVRQGATVLDLGTGTGILSYFASTRAPKTVYAIDHSERILEVAKEVGRHNGIGNVVFVNTNSKDFKPAEPIDVIIQEQMGHFLFDENMVENVVDLRDRVLKKGGRILPNRFDLFLEPTKMKDGRDIPFIWEQNIHGVRFDSLNGRGTPTKGSYGYRTIAPDHIDYYLCEPKPILSVDLETMRASDLPNEYRVSKQISKGGRLDGFCLYFNAVFDEKIILSTNPGPTSTGPRTTSWGHPLLRVESSDCARGDSVELHFTIGNVTDRNSYQWTCKVIRQANEPKEPPMNLQGRADLVTAAEV
jgi:SAM-dependent methyltransferase